ncbi:DUF2786 domain-containing protein [Aeromicrobium sp. UC242_57]|uniref:DUF2786 domain-containing protein n=1 Tax=Aeromicrobium sp. UC242_57 TaxID=3374624 RepID=UPI00378F664B
MLTQGDLITLIGRARRYAVASPRAAVPHIQQLNELAELASSPDVDPAVLVTDQVLSVIGLTWEHGWQPADLVHAAARRTSKVGARWLARAVLVHAERTEADSRAPDEWTSQLNALSSRHRHAGGTEGLLATAGRAQHDDWVTALVVLDFLSELPALPPLVPPPSRWGQPRQTPRTQPGPSGARDDHDKVLTRIRALLAKAESTEFAAEAEAFTAKAQDLMTRHSIDEALLAAEAGHSFDIGTIRVLIDHPYAREKANLLHVVAQANRIRAIWFDFASHASLVGVRSDLAQVEMLFTSLLVQATRAMTQAGEQSRGADRTSGFRKAFLTSYAVRINERLTEASQEAADSYGTDLVPIFQRQADAVEAEFERLYPHATQMSSRASYDARGWDAGAKAADQAVLPAGAVEA